MGYLIGLIVGSIALKAVAADVPLDVQRTRGWRPLAAVAGKMYGVPTDLILAVILTESSGVHDAVGSVNEVGLMQLTDPAVVEGFYQENYSEPAQNINAGTEFLRIQYDRTGDWFDALRAYNAGYEGSKGNKNIAKNYAQKVMENRKWF